MKNRMEGNDKNRRGIRHITIVPTPFFFIYLKFYYATAHARWAIKLFRSLFWFPKKEKNRNCLAILSEKSWLGTLVEVFVFFVSSYRSSLGSLVLKKGFLHLQIWITQAYGDTKGCWITTVRVDLACQPWKHWFPTIGKCSASLWQQT
jgi:hypothetical protein